MINMIHSLFTPSALRSAGEVGTIALVGFNDTLIKLFIVCRYYTGRLGYKSVRK